MTELTPVEKTDDEAAMEHAKEMAEKAQAADGATCIYGEKVFWLEYEKALVPGHIYSFMGKKEFNISRCCEFHFDDLMNFDDEDEDGESP